MKIALVMKEYSLERGGAERYVVNLSQQLAQWGHEVHLFLHRWNEPIDSLKVHPVPVLRFPPFLKILSFAVNASKCINKDNYHIVNGLTQIYPQDIYRLGGGIHKHWFRVKYPSLLNRFLKSLSPAHWINIFLEAQIYKRENFRKIITISQMDKELLKKYYHVPEDRIEVVYNGVDLDRFNPGVMTLYREKIRKELGIGEDEILLLFIGMNFARKGLKTIIEALSYLETRNPKPETRNPKPETRNPKPETRNPIKLLVLGKDRIKPYKEMAKRLGLEDKIIFLGITSHPERYYGASDIFVFPSRYDSFANVHLEAMACGLPVITSKTAGGSELIKEGINGFVLKDSLDAKELSRFITLSIPKRQEMGQEAAKIAQEFTIEKNAKRTLEIYEGTLKEKEIEGKEYSLKRGSFFNSTFLIINKDYGEFLKSHGLSDFQSIMSFNGGKRVKVHRKGGKIVREVIRFSFPKGADEKKFYLKRYLIPNIKDKLKSLFCLSSSIAKEEWKGVKYLTELKVPTIIPVAMGEKRRWGIIDKAFFLSLSMDHAISLEEFLKQSSKLKAQSSKLKAQSSKLKAQSSKEMVDRNALREKRELIRELALLFRKLHEGGIIYKDFIPKHIYIRKKGNGSLQLGLIDLQRIKKKGYLEDSVRKKSLLNFKALLPKGSFSKTDERRFFKAYVSGGNERDYHK